MIAGRESEAARMNETTMELPGDCEIVITRTFSGPTRIVFEVWTRPELVKRWWAPESLGVAVVGSDADVRAGGSYCYVLRLNSGAEFAFSGQYLEVTPHSRLVYTQFYEPTASGVNPGDEPVTLTVTFDENEGKTRLVSRTLCPSREVRDMILASGMEHGMRAAWQQLEDLVASLL